MSTELTVVLSVLGIGGLIGLFYISHSIEKQRREKALMIANISDTAYRLQRLLDSVPAPYLSKDLQLLLLNQIKKRLERLMELSPNTEKFRKKRDAASEQISEVSASTIKQQPPQLKTPEEAAELRKRLQEMSKTIESFMQNKIIDATEARKHLTTLHNSFFEANLSYLSQSAEKAKTDGKLKLAILNYEKVIKEMQKRNQKGAFSPRIEQVEALINAIRAELGTMPETEATDTDGELTQRMDEFLEEEDSWKKKYF